MSQLLQDLAKAALVIGALLLILALLWTLIRSAGSDEGGVTGAAKRTAAAVRGASADARKDPRAAARGALGAAGGLVGKARDGVRDTWREGAGRRREDADDRHHDRRNRRDDAGEPDKPTWRDRLTGRCPECSHHPKATAAATDGCPCRNTAWGCPCALRNRTAERHEPDLQDPGALASTDDPPPPPDNQRNDERTYYCAGGCGVEVGYSEWVCPDCLGTGVPQPAHPEPTDLDNHGGSVVDPNISPHSGDAMAATTGEVINIEQTRRVLIEIEQGAMHQVEQGDLAVQQAKSTATSVEQLLASLTTADLDPETLADISALPEHAAQGAEAGTFLMAAGEALQSTARRALDGLNQRHRVVEEAVNSTPHAAQTEWYQHA